MLDNKPRFKAILRLARISPRKLRYVIDLIRGKDVNAADSILKASPKRGSYFCKKLLQSALANATYYASVRGIDIDVNKLHIVDAIVNPGPTLKRYRPSSMRRPTIIRKRTSHAIIVLQERELKQSRKERQQAKKQKTPQEKKTQEKKIDVRKD